MSTEERKGVNWVQVVAAALAAMSSAVLLSTLGVAGTLIGAAVGSLTASVAGALYHRGIDASRAQVAAQAAALKRVAKARNEVDEAVAAMRRGEASSKTTLLRADEALVEAEHALQNAEDHETGEAGTARPEGAESTAVSGDRSIAQEFDAHIDNADESTSKLPWKRIAVVTLGVFLAAMVAISAFELITGRAVSTYTGGTDSDKGTTVPGLGRVVKEEPAVEPQDEPSLLPSESPSELPSEGLTTEPTEEPEQSPTTEPTGPTSIPTAVPTPSPTVTPAPSPTGSVG